MSCFSGHRYKSLIMSYFSLILICQTCFFGCVQILMNVRGRFNFVSHLFSFLKTLIDVNLLGKFLNNLLCHPNIWVTQLEKKNWVSQRKLNRSWLTRFSIPVLRFISVCLQNLLKICYRFS
jgi:hypothetical protein